MNGQSAVRADERRGSWILAFAAIAIATWVAYGRTFAVPFQFDDFDQIQRNLAIQKPTVDTLLKWGRARLIPYLTLALNWRLGGENTAGYHAVNLAIHLLASFFVFRLALALCETPRLRETAPARNRLALATAAGVVFACHPIQIQAVTYIVQRVSSLCALFYVGSVLAYVSARNRSLEGEPEAGRLYFMAVALAAGALFSKENAATLPVALILVEWLFHPAGSLRRSMRLWLPFAAVSFAAPLMWVVFWRAPRRVTALTGPNATWLDNLLRAASPSGPVSPIDYFLTQCMVIPRYLRLVFLPWGFNVDPDVAIERGLSGPVLRGIALLAGLLVLGLYARRRWPLLAFAILWMFVTLAVESSFLPIGDPMMEHRMYLPMAGIAIGLGAVFAHAYRRFRGVSVVSGLAIGASLVALTIARNEVWRTELGLWSDAVEKSPGKARVQTNVGVFLEKSGRIDDAIAHYCKALEIDPTHPNVRRNLEIVLQAKIDQQLEAEEEVDVTVDEKGQLVLNVDDACKRMKAPRALPRLRLPGE